MRKAQRERYLPMPDHEVDGSVSMTIHGGIVDPAYTSRADYILTRAQDDEHYAKLLMDFLKKFGAANRNDLEKLLLKNLRACQEITASSGGGPFPSSVMPAKAGIQLLQAERTE